MNTPERRHLVSELTRRANAMSDAELTEAIENAAGGLRIGSAPDSPASSREWLWLATLAAVQANRIEATQ